MGTKVLKTTPNGFPHTNVLLWMSLFTAFLILITLTTVNQGVGNMVPDFQEVSIETNQKGYVIKTPGCKIPDLPISDKTIEGFFKETFEDPRCNNGKPPLVEANQTSLFILEKSLGSYNLTSKSQVHCCYEEMKRKVPHGQSDSQYEFSDWCEAFQDVVEVEEEFVHVKCSNPHNATVIYEDFFAFIPKKFDQVGDGLSVLVVGIDGVSRLNLHRQMPKFAKYLEELQFQEFLGYNKIADNTYPNLIAVLTGHDEATTVKTCRKSGKYYDNCSFVWNEFKRKNYVTSFGEDSAWMGIFNYQKYGFQKQPTDYMWGFFDRVSENLIGNSKVMNVIQCIGAREGFKMIVRYIFDFVEKMNEWRSPYFGFFWSSSLSHDFVNKPRIGDQFYLEFFQKLRLRNYLDNAVIFVMSDHGIRFGSFRQTYQGMVEERLPFLAVRLPESFIRRYPEASANLRRNLKRLTTPFDLHQTLLDLADLGNLGGHSSEFGRSFFGRIEGNRTCESAGIADHWCTCLSSSSLHVGSDRVRNVTKFVVGFLNGLLEGYAQCARLELKEIRRAQLLFHDDEKGGGKSKVEDVLVSFVTGPGDGFFEATVREKGGRMEVVGSVSRLNLYGSQSSCMADFHLKLYCYCKGLIWN